MIKAKGRSKAIRHTSDFYTKKIVTQEGIIQELKVHVLIDDIKKIFKEFISGISFSITELNKDDSYGISIFSVNKEREIRVFVYKEMICMFCYLQMKHEKDDVITDHIFNTTLLSEDQKNAYEALSNSFKKDGIDIREFFNKRKFVLIRFLQGDDSQIE